MAKFTDQLFDDLMRDHGPALAGTRVPAAPKRHLATRPVLLTAGAGSLAVAATVGTLVAGGGTPAYAVTTHADGTVTLAVYQKSGIAQANAKLRQVGDGQVVVVPVESGCPSMSSLPRPAVLPHGKVKLRLGFSTGGATVDAHGIPAGDILVVAFEASTANGMTAAAMKLTSGPAPSCVNNSATGVFAHPGTGGGIGTGTGGGTGSVTTVSG